MHAGQHKPAFLPLLGPALRRIVTRGRLTIVDWRGGVSHFGAGHLADAPAYGLADGPALPAITIRFHEKWLPVKIALSPGLATGEAYMRGALTIDGADERGDLRGFLSLVTGQPKPIREPRWVWMINQIVQRLVWLVGGNNRARAARNVAHHYDLTSDFYRLFLDAQMQYSCAYFRDGSETLEQAQTDKIRHIAAKLCLAPGQSVLDIGCGWGGLALALSREHHVRVTGVTLSQEQLVSAQARAQAARLDDQITFARQDYRDVAGQFDRIVSVGMLEHVGFAQFETYFAHVARMLAPEGVALIHAIGRSDNKGGPDPWTQRYIFPGGYIPALSEVLPAIERSGLIITDIEILRLHYAETLRHWFARFTENRAAAQGMYGETFCRMWEFYLAAAEMSFRHRPLIVFQIQLAHAKRTVPLTRDYIAAAENSASELAADCPLIAGAMNS